MTKQKTNNTFNIWEKEGFEVNQIVSRKVKRKLVDCRVYVKKDDEVLKMTMIWPTIKKMAARQNYYAFPIKTCNSDGFSVIQMVDKDRIINIHRPIHHIIEQLYKSYWYVQRDRDVILHLYQLSEVEKELITFEREVKLLNNRKDDDLLDDGVVWKRLETVKSTLNTIITVMTVSDKYSYSELAPLVFFTENKI